MNIPEAEQKILEEVEYYKERYFAFDEPIPFCGLELHPVKTRNYNEFMQSIECLRLNKNDDPAGIRKTHLEYLTDKFSDEETGREWSSRFSRLIELVFNIKNGLRCKKCGRYISFEEYMNYFQKENKEFSCECGGKIGGVIEFRKDEETNRTVLIVNGHDIKYQDFQRMRKIVLYQNLPDFKDDSFISKDIREDEAEKDRLNSKQNGGATASLERKIVCVSSRTTYKFEELYEMPIRKFLILFSAVDDVINYTAERIGLMTGMVSSKSQPEHWIYKKERDLYEKGMSLADLTNKIGGS